TNGLDPAGQREVRALLQAYAAKGRTVLVSSHLLHEVQETCTHVAILRKGKLVAEGPLADLLSRGERLVVEVDDPARAAALAQSVEGVHAARVDQGLLILDAQPDAAARVNRALVQAGLAVSALRRERQGLEARFLEITEETP